MRGNCRCPTETWREDRNLKKQRGSHWWYIVHHFASLLPSAYDLAPSSLFPSTLNPMASGTYPLFLDTALSRGPS